MYRTIALALLEANQEPQDDTIAPFLASIRLDFVPSAEATLVYLNGADVTEQIRVPLVSQMASNVAKLGAVRTALVNMQREIGYKQVRENGGMVLDGRDIGTVVFPDADLKIFLVAELEARAKRRVKELEAKGATTDLAQTIEEMRKRDEQDSQRALAPLKKAVDAIELDTTSKSIHEQVGFVLQQVQKLAYTKQEKIT